ncbi:MAG: aspartate-semialdehyde dehydrogenase [Candidatus Marinimicrobia bacterium]|nr:aspartate-semialdehyde dehydrogenase [Candidatus Neomarinimicrobiota bacterium]
MKIKVGILGATGSVGQKFIQLLENHPWFEISEVAASERSAGKMYRDAVNWFMQTPIPEKVAVKKVKECVPTLDCQIVFSGLDASVAGEIETAFAHAGYAVISNSRNHRFDPDVPLLIPEINADHLKLIREQKYGQGFIITNPNCSTIGMSLPLKPIHDRFGIEAVHVVTMQALSGAGYPGVSSLDILDNVVPYIGSEESKMQTEPLKILGKLEHGQITAADIKFSAQCNRVAVIDGHLEALSIKLKTQTNVEEIKQCWANFKGEPQELELPMAPKKPVVYFEEENLPQPKLQRNLDKGMAVSVGRLQPCPVLDFKFIALSHNTVRGAAGAAILNAELIYKKGLLN